MYECLRKGLRKIDPGLVVVLVAALFVIQPFLRPGLPSIADAPIHMFRTAELDRCWADGVYYPRWAPNLAFGYGYPLFLFAPPLPYFIIELFHVLGATLESATKLLAMVCFLLGGMGMYLFVKEVLGAGPAMLAAVAYVYAPFQLREALIYGGNYPQLLAIAFFPFILWAVQRLIVTGRSVYIPVSAFLYGGLILSHNFHALVFSPLLFFYVLFLLSLGGRWRQWRRIVSVCSSVALGLGLTAFFWIPALYERQWCKAQEEFYISRSDFHLRFLDFRELLGFPAPLDTAVADPHMPFSLGPAILFLAIVGVLASSLGSIRLAKSRFNLPHEEKLHVAFFALVLVVTVFMLLPISTPVWENVPFLATAEFPWRLMGVATLAVAFLAGASLRLWRDVGPFWRGLALLVGSVLLVLLASAVYLYPPKPFLPYGSPSLAESVRFEWVTQTIGTTTLGEYLPIWVKDVPTTSPMMPAYLGGQAIDKLDREVLPDSAQAEGLGHTVVSDGYRFRSDEAFTARFHTFYFPGWRAYVDGRPVDIEIVEPRGLIAVPVPAGEREVWVRFEGTPDRAISSFLSLLALAGSLVVFVAAVLGRRRKRLSMIKATVAARNLPLGQAASLTCVLLALFFVKAVIIDPHTDLFRRRSPPGQVIGIGHPAHVNLGDEVLFLGYDLWDEKVRQGDELRLRLYWQALRPLERDYSSFVHLDARPDLTTWAGSDNPHPGDARAQIDIPTSTWAPGTYIRDEHRLMVPKEVPTAEYILRVGLYDQRTGERLPVLSEDGGMLADAVALQPIHVLRAHPLKLGQLPYQERFVLGDRIELLGYALNSTSLEAGEALEVRLYWRARVEVDGDYTVFVHLLDEEGGIRGQKDSSPLNGMYPTSSWLAGQVIEDPHTFLLEERVAPGRYRIAVGMYELKTLQRLEAVDARGERLPEERIVLSQVVEVKEPMDR